LGNWSEDEELLIFYFVRLYDCDWTKISNEFADRSKISIRNKFINSFKKKKLTDENKMFDKFILERKIDDIGKLP
jgi:hypothetical protein